MFNVRVDGALKHQATEALSAMGLSASDAVRLLLHRIVADQAFPLELKVPNAATRAAMSEAALAFSERRARFGSATRCWPGSSAASNRAPHPHAADYTKTFSKDWERLSRAGRWNMRG